MFTRSTVSSSKAGSTETTPTTSRHTRTRAQPVQGRPRRDRFAGIERGVDPGGGGFPCPRHGFIQGIARRKAAGQIRGNHPEGRGVITGFYHDRIAHDVLMKTSQLPDRGDQANTQALLRVRPDQMALMLWMEQGPYSQAGGSPSGAHALR
jgi:hypothetical protein